MSNAFESYAFASNPYASNAFCGAAVPAPPSAGTPAGGEGRRTQTASGSWQWPSWAPASFSCVLPDGTEADKEPSFAAKVATLLRSGKDHERRTKSRPAPEREIIYNLRSRLARIKEVVARLEAERRCLVQATRKQQAEYQAAMSDLLLQVAVLERDLKERQAEYQAEVLDLLLQVVTLECNLITSQRDCAALLAALEAERGARLRGTILVGAGLGTAGLTWAAIPSRYAWMGYTTAVGLVLRGLLELILPAGLQPTQ